MVFTYQWYKDATPIDGADSNAYVVQESDKGFDISCSVTAYNVNGNTSAFSNAIGIPDVVVDPGDFDMTSIKSVILDIADSWGSISPATVIDIRSIEFFLNDVLIPMTTGFTAYATTDAGAGYTPDLAFNTSLLKTGTWLNTSWASSSLNITNQRLIIVFDTPTEFNKIVINNAVHQTGLYTSAGAKNTKITVSLDVVTDTTYDAVIANSLVLFNGIIAQHPAVDAIDDQVIWEDIAFDPSIVPDSQKFYVTVDTSSLINALTDFPLTIFLENNNPSCVNMFNNLSIDSRKFSIESEGVQLPVEIESWVDRYNPNYSPEFSATYSKATSIYAVGYQPWYPLNPAVPLTGTIVSSNTTWLASSGLTPQKYNVDLGVAKIIRRLRLDNMHHNGTQSEYGIKDFIIYGTDSATAFDNTTYADTTDLTELGSFSARAHVALDQADPEYFDLSSNDVAYRYYVLRIANSQGAYSYMGFRRLEFEEHIYNAVLHTKVPLLPVSSSINLTFSYDGTQSDNTNVDVIGSTIAQTVWDDNFVAVYHFGELPSVGIKNSKSVDYAMTPNGTMDDNDLLLDTYGYSLTFDGASYLENSDPVVLANFTYEAFLNITSFTYDNPVAIHFGTSGLSFAASLNKTILLYGNNAIANMPTPVTGEDHYLAGTKDDIIYGMYLDGVDAKNTFSPNSGWGLSGNKIGDGYLTDKLNGTIGEVRVSDIARSADWINMTYLSLTNQLVTYSEYLIAFDPSIVPNSQKFYVTVDTSTLTEELTDFPLTIFLENNNPSCVNMFNNLSVGSKRFSIELSGVQLPIEIESWYQGSNTDTENTYTITANGSGYTNHTLRAVHDLSVAGVTGHISQIRIWIPAVAGGISWEPISCYVGKHAGGNNVNFADTPIKVLFGGLDSAPTGTIGVWSDWMDCNFEDIDDIVTSIGCTYTSPPYCLTTDSSVLLYGGQIVGSSLAGDVTIAASMNIYHFSAVGFETRVLENPKLTLHTKVPSLPVGSNVDLIFSYDGTQSDNTNVDVIGSTIAQTVWDNNYLGVYHMSQDPSGGAGCMLDSTSNALHGTPYGSMITEDLIEGESGKYIDFDGVDDFIDIPITAPAGNVTYEILFNKKSLEATTGLLTTKGDITTGYDTTPNFLLQDNSGTLRSYGITNTYSTVETITVGNWYFTTITRNATYIEEKFAEGISVGTVARASNGNLSKVSIGAGYAGFADTMIGEVRISNIVRSADWINMTYLSITNQLNTISSLWTPDSIVTGLWLDASDASTITIDTGVSVWADKSGNGLDASQPTVGYQPTIQVAELNGLDVMYFDNVDDYLQGLVPNLTSISIFSVRRCLAATGTSYSNCIYDSGNATSFGSSSGVRFDKFNGLSRLGTNGTFLDIADVSTIWGLQGGIKTAGSRSLWLNSVQIDSDANAGDITQLSTHYTIGKFQISAESPPSLGPQPFYGSIAELIIIPNAVDTSTRQIIEGYLSWKWGLQANLPVDHPYKDAAPRI